jgi:hypothetical protein
MNELQDEADRQKSKGHDPTHVIMNGFTYNRLKSECNMWSERFKSGLAADFLETDKTDNPRFLGMRVLLADVPDEFIKAAW